MSARKKPLVRVWLAADGWRWEYRAENGLLQAVSSEGYTRRGDCVTALRRVSRGFPIAEIEIGPGPARAPDVRRSLMAANYR